MNGPVLALGASAATRVTRLDGTVLWRTRLRGAAGLTCDWCNERGQLAIYTWGARTRTVHDAAFCSLHCWGQPNGFVDL